MFDLIATRYDFINRALALNLDIGWRKVMVREITKHVQVSIDRHNIQKGDTVQFLDLATGTADVAILLAKEYEDHFQTAAKKKGKKRPKVNNFHILGVDPSINMINVGKQKILSEKLSDTIHLELGDARELTNLSDNSFDSATMSFGIRNVPEKEVAFCEIHRVLKKDGYAKLAILEFSEPSADSGVMGSLARLFIRHVVPTIGAILSGAPREYMHLQNSIKEFPTPKQFVALLEGVKCKNGGKSGTFRVDKLKHLNFGSVQLYVATPIYT